MPVRVFLQIWSAVLSQRALPHPPANAVTLVAKPALTGIQTGESGASDGAAASNTASDSSRDASKLPVSWVVLPT
ncbi:hypothetical protein PR002_g31993 [Phytophthora rubi]|uniref:Uncharacterized protein n=1 Tax=Phytophthora rubi TaxID=129364 RepID=A0A6A3G8C7_9STRA|nr:hypothetical protein PR002_g31993 [Phytophthora rubi]